MDSQALGLVETLGLVPAIEAADTAVKSADVSLAGLEYIGAGLVTVKLLGDISSVKAGVEAARSAAARLGTVQSWTVIGRTGEGVPVLIDPTGAPGNPGPDNQGPGDLRPDDQGPDLAGMRVVKLRQVARSLAARAASAKDSPGFPLKPKQIKYAKKEELISVIARFLDSRTKADPAGEPSEP